MRKLILVAAVVIATFCSGSIASGQGRVVDLGDTVDYIFNEPLVDGLGLSSLRELRGKPVLVEFWGTR